jgi:ubiquinone/menaquinone biosynthesis C-methylase UbiE
MERRPRYDGLAEWYDDVVRGLDLTATVTATLAELLGPGPGRCLDLGCGTGVVVPVLAGLGWRAVGVDDSADQLRVARRRAGHLAAGSCGPTAPRCRSRRGRWTPSSRC